MALSTALYDWLAGWAPFLIGWTAVFTVLTTVRIILARRAGVSQARPSVAFTEAAALPLAILQSVCFCKAAKAGDILSLGLFLWWGPGFIWSAWYYLDCKRRGVKANWYPYRRVISWLCKLNYLAFAVVFWRLGHYGLLFAYSAWIINDQYGLAFLSRDADRLRRTFDDYWLIRLAYPGGLLLPWFVAMPHAALWRGYGALLLVLWGTGIAYVRSTGRITGPPEHPTLLRNLPYLPG